MITNIFSNFELACGFWVYWNNLKMKCQIAVIAQSASISGHCDYANTGIEMPIFENHSIKKMQRNTSSQVFDILNSSWLRKQFFQHDIEYFITH